MNVTAYKRICTRVKQLRATYVQERTANKEIKEPEVMNRELSTCCVYVAVQREKKQ